MTKRCHFLDCKNKILSMVIDCSKCKNYFCSMHRLPEKHECKFLKEIKEDAKNMNTKTLMDNKCVIGQL